MTKREAQKELKRLGWKRYNTNAYMHSKNRMTRRGMTFREACSLEGISYE